MMNKDEFIGAALTTIRRMASHEEVPALEPIEALTELIRAMHHHKAELSPVLGARLLQISTGIYKTLDIYKSDQNDSKMLAEMVMQLFTKGDRDGA